MRILHTADWHIGQLFYNYDRTNEHQHFLNWLRDKLKNERIDVLLISGDVFDLSNPSAASIKMFYTFLRDAMDSNPELQIIITAGNHDSAHRLEAPKPLLENGRIHIIGLIERSETGEIDYEKLLIPIHDKDGQIKVWCMAVPYLRLGEYPHVKDCDNPYTAGVETLYKELYEVALTKKTEKQSIIAMGHLHALHCEISDADNHERSVLGGLDGIPCSAFHKEIKYVALGHIHKAQKIAGNHHIRYCGSPLPMSFTEHQYKHQVLVFEIPGNPEMNIQSLEIPLTVSLKRIPEKHQPLPEVLLELEKLEKYSDKDRNLAPYLWINVLLEGPEPSLRYKIETALDGKYVRLCKIDSKYRQNSENEQEDKKTKGQLQELSPFEILNNIYENKYQSKLPDDLGKLFMEVVSEVDQQEN